MSDGTDNHVTSSGPVPPSRYIAFAVIAAAGLAADLVSKEIVFSWPGKLTGHVDWLWQGHAGIQTSLNEGALFGVGYGQVGLFAAVSVLAAIAIPAWLFAGRAAHDWWLTIALGGVMAGVLGNLYDRLGLSGETWPAYDPRAGETVYAVRDWILWQLNDQWRWPNFNLADAFLVVGAGVLFLRAMFEPNAQAEGTSSQATLTE
ncbi:lipoprotein signal peptidase [Botrimarina colliarenosi]|uniref:Lipoprotein signal peptidase n=1 Tax=Botrimarina colliarenosi TaxID=2528001 RepID=A0A5C6AET0_9BACT|nr:signal peptidase II [Botrimarina colliarenosi]TWT97828.1 lipoprotein signal peptidase [Botrimarina colliarenosi]